MFGCRGMGAETKVVVCRALKKAEQYSDTSANEDNSFRNHIR